MFALWWDLPGRGFPHTSSFWPQSVPYSMLGSGHWMKKQRSKFSILILLHFEICSGLCVPIKCNDDYIATLDLFRYIYTGNWFLSPYFPSMLYAANKYLLAELRKELLLYIEAVSNNLYYQTALFILDDIILLSEAKAIEQCLKAIDAKAVPLLAWSEFKTIKYATLHCILSRDTLQASEVIFGDFFLFV